MKNKFLQTFIISVIAGLITIETYSQEKNPRGAGRTQMRNDSYSVNIDDSDDPFTMNITFKDEGKLYKMKVVDSKIVEMTVDGKKVPQEDFSKYDKQLKQILAKIAEDRKKAEEDRKQAEIEREKAELDRDQADSDRKQADRERDKSDRDRERASSDREEASRERDRASRDERNADRNAESHTRERKRSEREHERAEDERASADKERRHSEEYRERAEQDREESTKDRERANVDRKRAETDRKLLNDLIDDVVKENLAKEEDEINSLVLDEKKFTINGKEQSEELHKKFKEKYLKKTGSRIHYRNDRNFRGLSIDN